MGDGKSYKFLSSRTHKAHLRSRAQKFQRAVVGATLQDIMAKRNQKPEVRKAQREQAVRAAKDQKKATVKKPAVKDKAAQKAQKATKNVQKAGPGRVGGKR